MNTSKYIFCNYFYIIIYFYLLLFLGIFDSMLSVDVIGQVNDKLNPFLTHLQVISTMDIKLIGSSDPIMTKKRPAFNPG